MTEWTLRRIRGLRRIAEEATCVDWRQAGSHYHPNIVIIADTPPNLSRLEFKRSEDARHCATFDPPTVSSLLNVLEAQQAELEAAREVIESTEAARWHTCPLCNCVPSVPCKDYYRLLVRVRDAREVYDAARAGKDE